MAYFMLYASYRGVYCGVMPAFGICDAIRAALQLKSDGYHFSLEILIRDSKHHPYEFLGVCNG